MAQSTLGRVIRKTLAKTNNPKEPIPVKAAELFAEQLFRELADQAAVGPVLVPHFGIFKISTSPERVVTFGGAPRKLPASWRLVFRASSYRRGAQ